MIIVIAISFLSSCGTGEEVNKVAKTRTIKNTSSHVVDLTINANNKYQYQLNTGDSIIFEGYCLYGPASEYCEMGWDGSEPINGEIVFDNEKKLIYENENCENGRNPLNPILWELHDCGYYNQDTDGDGLSEYIYEITDADYEMAVPIND